VCGSREWRFHDPVVWKTTLKTAVNKGLFGQWLSVPANGESALPERRGHCSPSACILKVPTREITGCVTNSTGAIIAVSVLYAGSSGILCYIINFASLKR